MTTKPRGGSRPGAGRPAGTVTDNPRTEQMAQRYTAREVEIITEAAGKADETLSDYVRSAAIERAAFRTAAHELGVPLDPVAVKTAIRMLKGRRHTLAEEETCDKKN